MAVISEPMRPEPVKMSGFACRPVLQEVLSDIDAAAERAKCGPHAKGAFPTRIRTTPLPMRPGYCLE